MFKRILFICLIVLSFSCEKEKTTYTITGTAEGVKDGTEVKLQELFNNRPTVLAKTTVENGKFSFTGSVENKDMYFINMSGAQGSLPFILENDNIDIAINSKNINESVVKGTAENDLFASYGESLRDGNRINQELSLKYQEAQKTGDELALETIVKSFDSLKLAQNNYELNFVKKNKESLMSLKVLERMMHSRSFSSLEIQELFNNFPEELREGPSGKNITKFLKPMLATAEGAVAPNFEAPNPEGKLLALNDITSKNKVTIVDFWAAWCGPCRRENPNLVRIYEKYHDKGLEIVGVSLDGSSKQTDAKAAWIKAIKDDGLTWKQVSNLKYFQDPIAQSYSINAIPATFVLDQEGKIIGKELRGQALEDKIAELLN